MLLLGSAGDSFFRTVWARRVFRPKWRSADTTGVRKWRPARTPHLGFQWGKARLRSRHIKSRADDRPRRIVEDADIDLGLHSRIVAPLLIGIVERSGNADHP